MKIICLAKNYISSHSGSECGCVKPEHPLVFMKPDSALLKDGKPFFVPDFSDDIRFSSGLAVRICRLGKCISQHFAHRYYDAVTLGVDFTACDLLDSLSREGNPWELSKIFDGSAVIGSFLSLEQVNKDVQRIKFRLELDGQTVQSSMGEMLFGVDETIAYVSRFMTLKMGDLLFMGTSDVMTEAKVGGHLRGFIEEEKVLDFHMR